MIRLEIHYRDKIVNMGLPECGVFTAIVSAVNRSPRISDAKDCVYLHLGGLDSISNEQVDWDTLNLVPGDAVQITVVEDGEVDPPTTRKPLNTKAYREQQEQEVRSAAAKYGWTIIENPSSGDEDS
ncbi:hypothetical protein GC197_15135 [bacterium]|nr:hypothetical protein [bacterium]